MTNTELLASARRLPAPSKYHEVRRSNGGSRSGFVILQVALDMEGLVTAALWQPREHIAGHNGAGEVVVSVKAVVAAIRDGHPVVALFPSAGAASPERRFFVEDRGWKGATVVLGGPPSFGRNLHDLYMLFLGRSQ